MLFFDLCDPSETPASFPMRVLRGYTACHGVFLREFEVRANVLFQFRFKASLQ
jgi:hypothetical protein